MTSPTIPPSPHEDDLREIDPDLDAFLIGLRRAVVSAEGAVYAQRHGGDPGPDLTASVERAWDALRCLGTVPTNAAPTPGETG